MNRGILALVVAGSLVPALLACGGVWDQAVNDAVVQEFNKMDGQLSGVADSPEKASVQALIDQGRLDAVAGKIGIIEIATFQVEFEQAKSDGAIDAGEAAKLKTAYDDIVR